MDYAIKELEIERCVVGVETDHLRQDMAGAEYWIEYLKQKYRTEVANGLGGGDY